MKKIFQYVLLLLVAIATFSIAGFGQSSDLKADAADEKPVYNADLAKRLGGDERGMKTYVLVILKTGSKDGDFKGKERDDIFAGHMSNIGKLADAQKLAVAGPFVPPNDKGYRGLYIFNVTTLEEAKTIVQTDPAVKAGILVADMSLWYGSASLMAMPEIHKTIAKPKQ